MPGGWVPACGKIFFQKVVDVLPAPDILTIPLAKRLAGIDLPEGDLETQDQPANAADDARRQTGLLF